MDIKTKFAIFQSWEKEVASLGSLLEMSEEQSTREYELSLRIEFMRNDPDAEIYTAVAWAKANR